MVSLIYGLFSLFVCCCCCFFILQIDVEFAMSMSDCFISDGRCQAIGFKGVVDFER